VLECCCVTADPDGVLILFSIGTYPLHQFIVPSSILAKESVTMGFQDIDDIEKPADSSFTSPAATIDAIGLQAPEITEVQTAKGMQSP
jgi:hypothetical protein